MKCLLVIAHPREDSLCHALAGVARAALIAEGHDVTVEDLYANGFQPALTAEEQLAFRGTAEMSAGMERLREAEVLVLVFPTWWFGFPAILKGWFDRVWAPGAAYEIAPESKALQPRLSALRHAVAITTLGSPRWIDWLVLRQPVKRILKRALIGACAPRARFRYLPLHSAEGLDAARFEGFAAKIRSAVGRINPSSE